MRHDPRGFTLIELLVVVTIIVILLALLTPAMDRAIYAAEKVQCLSRQKVLITSSQIYATDQKKYFPPNALPGMGSATAYDTRMWFDDNGNPTPYIYNPGAAVGPKSPNLQLGLLPQAGYLPVEQLGKVMHCPTLDNTGNNHSAFGSGTGMYTGVGMDMVTDYAVGASGYNDPEWDAVRIIIGYHYRAASFERSGKGRMRMTNMTSDDLMTVDMPDQRFAGLTYGPGTIVRGVNEADMRAFSHPDGYGRSFADGHVSFLDDSDYAVAWECFAGGGSYGIMAADTPGNAGFCESIYTKSMNRD